MKTFRIIGFALFAILLCLSACSGGGEEEPIKPTPQPEIIKSEITIDSSIITNGLSFTNEKGEQSVSFSSNENWTLSVANTTNGTAWCAASATSGSKGSATVKLSVTENTSYDNRSVSVTIKSGSATKTFTISQKGVDALLVTTDKYEVGLEGGSIEIEVKANIDYKMEISENAKEWIKESSGRALTTYKHALTIDANEEAEKREGEIYFKSGDKTETVKVYQTGSPVILLSQNEYDISEAGDTISVEVKSNVEYGIQMPEVDWIIDEASSRGMSSHTLKYIIKANETSNSRSAEIIFYDKNSELKEVLKVIQEPTERIILSEKNITIDSKGGTFEVRINKNIDYRVGNFFTDWIKEESVDYSNHAIKYMIGSNNNMNSREGFLVFGDKNSALSDTITITQSGLEPATDFEMISLGDNLSMHSKGLALQYEGITNLYEFFDAIYDEAICKKIYTKFEDAFDFIFFLYNTSGEEFSYGGFSYPINRNISGIGRENVDISSRFGTNGKLKNVNHLTFRTSLFSEGPFLHELAHHWGAAYIGQEYATPNGTYETESHWGTTDINGILGGFDYSTLERNVDGDPKKYRATCSRSKEWGFEGFSQELSNGYYAPMELYLMGLISASEVPDMHVFKNVKVEDYSGTFYADSEITYTIEDFIAKYGERVPDYQSSQKDFRALVVVVTNEPVSAEHWTLIERDILNQEKQESANDMKQTNFWEATGGRATLTISGIDKFLKK